MSKQCCPHCGSNMNSYKVRATPILLSALVKFRVAVTRKGVNSVHLLNDFQDDIKLTRHEWNNFTRQRFLGLAVRDKQNRGHWQLTATGNGFLNGNLDIPSFVTVSNGKVIDSSGDLLNVKDVIGTTPYVETIDDIEYVTASPVMTVKFDKNGQGVLI